MKLENLKVGDLIFEKERSILGSLIRLATKSWANHVALYIGDGQVIEANPGGTKIKSVNKYLYPILRKVRFFRINVSDDKILNMVEIAKTMNGYKYDYIQIISLFFLLKTGLKEELNGLEFKNFTICSELIDLSAKKAGIVLTSISSANVTPDDIMKSDLLIQI